MTHSIRTTHAILATATLGLAIFAGCATNPRTPAAGVQQQAEPVAAAAAPSAPVKPVDPWARSVPAAPSTPVGTAEPAAATPATPPAESAAPAEAAGNRTHTVAKGESLYAISVKYYGTGTKWPKIVEANPGLVPERLPAGKTIVIP